MSVGALAAAAVLVAASSAAAFSTASVRFFGTGGSTTVDRITVRVDPPAPADVGAGDFTVELWLRGTLADNTTPTGGGRSEPEADVVDWIYGNIIVDRDIYGGGPDWGMSIHRNAGRGVLRFGTEGAGGNAHTLQGSAHVLDGAWHHVAFVRERTSGVKRIHVDGVLDVQSRTGASTDDLSYPNGRATGFPSSDPFLVFAAEKHGFPGGSGFPSFAGWIDEIRVWNVARSGAQLDAARATVLPGNTPGLVLSLRLEEGTGQALGDATGGNAATLYAGAAGNGEWSTETPPMPGTTTTTAPATTTTTTSSSSSTTTSSSTSSTTTVPSSTTSTSRSTTSTTSTSTSSAPSTTSTSTTVPSTTMPPTTTSTTATTSSTLPATTSSLSSTSSTTASTSSTSRTTSSTTSTSTSSSSSTTSSSSSTSTSTSSTSSSRPGGCATGADCTAGEACTEPRCEDGTCRYPPLAGPEGVSCQLGRLSTAAPCGTEPIDGRLQKAIERRADAARRFVGEMAASGERRRRRLRARALRHVGALAQQVAAARRRGLSGDCRERLDAALADVRRLIRDAAG